MSEPSSPDRPPLSGPRLDRYSEDDLVAALAEVGELVRTLRAVPPDRLLPFTEPVLQLHHLVSTLTTELVEKADQHEQ